MDSSVQEHNIRGGSIVLFPYELLKVLSKKNKDAAFKCGILVFIFFFKCPPLAVF